ncbi:trypsin-like peptidase domain-containing protein [candidate division WOR-3 bacterium]|nr:trypsin-like peptidase domain-containing protein [candidate division WOR-3 bacterium]
MALIPPIIIDCVVAIGFKSKNDKIRWCASGFLYGHCLNPQNDSEKKYRVYLVTNRHVIEKKKEIYLRFNPKGYAKAKEYLVLLKGEGKATVVAIHSDPDIDLGVVSINTNFLDKDKIQYRYIADDVSIASLDKLKEMGFYEGDFCYILGFPMGLVGAERNFVIVRQGIIARLQDYLSGVSKQILIDCMIFPGSSGGPVVNKPEVACITGTKSPNTALIIGIVAGYITYREEAISLQTGKTRVTFEENSGLALVIPIQYVYDFIDKVTPKKFKKY